MSDNSDPFKIYSGEFQKVHRSHGNGNHSIELQLTTTNDQMLNQLNATGNLNETASVLMLRIIISQFNITGKGHKYPIYELCISYQSNYNEWLMLNYHPFCLVSLFNRFHLDDGEQFLLSYWMMFLDES